ncbi:hypothetical protein PHMEG_00013047 [Phytophthora megakarya]|uniref:PiggyBac transposable element-derived protein domain-containing protein n=1 Tax=Phytophthora megakarya TaxID=4795 RepID=A0A225W7A3_9STRA|nr:hypothetical protein PHMEG_00013047 [Phytophthora megakarya]
MGIVKTATVEYPKDYFSKWCDSKPSRGSFTVLSSTSDLGNEMYAMCWADKKPKSIIANRGTTLPAWYGRKTVRYEKRIPRPHMIELFFIRDTDHVSFCDFTSQLAHQLIFNSRPCARTRRSPTNTANGEDQEGETAHSIKALIDLPQYATARAQGKRAQRQCKHFNKKASYNCEDCSDIENGVIYSICGSGAGRNCLSSHFSVTST